MRLRIIMANTRSQVNHNETNSADIKLALTRIHLTSKLPEKAELMFKCLKKKMNELGDNDQPYVFTADDFNTNIGYMLNVLIAEWAKLISNTPTVARPAATTLIKIFNMMQSKCKIKNKDGRDLSFYDYNLQYGADILEIWHYLIKQYLMLNQNVDLVLGYIKQHRNLAELYYKIQQDLNPTQNHEGLRHVHLTAYYGCMAFYSYRQNDYHNLDIYLAKGEVAAETAGTYNYNVGETILKCLEELHNHLTSVRDYVKAIHYLKKQYEINLNSIYRYEVMIQEHKTGKLKIEDTSVRSLSNAEKFMSILKNSLAACEKKIKICENLLKIEKQSATAIRKKDLPIPNQKGNNNNENNNNAIKPISTPEQVQIVNIVKNDEIKEEKKEKDDSDSKVIVKEKMRKKDLKEQKNQKKRDGYKSKGTNTESNTESKTEIPCIAGFSFFTADKPYRYYGEVSDKTFMDSNIFKLRGAIAHRQYVCITPKLIQEINEKAGSARKEVVKWMGGMIERGLILGNSKGRKGFLLIKDENQQPFLKGKDTSTAWRLRGHIISVVNDPITNKEHTVWGLDGIKMSKKATKK